MKIQEGELFNSRYRLISEKGRGAFGEVWLAHDEQIDLDVAVKIYIALDEHGVEDFKSEYKTAYSLNHPNLLHAYHFDVIEKHPFLVMPFCPGSAEANVGTSDEALIWRFIKDVSSGLAYLHSKNIIHRDIKPDNVLVDAEGNFLITDFGVSTKMKSTLRRNSTRSMTDEDISGTIGYMAPELFTKNPEAVKATDIWALGATLFEMINGEIPFYGQGGIMLEKGAEIPELKGAWSNDLRRTVEACLAKEPWDRPTASQLAAYATKCVDGNFEKAPWKEPGKSNDGETVGGPCKTVRFADGNAVEPSTLTDQEEQESEQKEEIQNNFDQIDGWTAFFLWCGIGLGLVISTIRSLVTVFTPGIDAITIVTSLVYVTLFLLIGIEAIIAFYKKQENAVPLATAYCIMIAMDAVYLLIMNWITNSSHSWGLVVRNMIWSGVWLTYLYSSENIKEKFPQGTRKWHNREKIVLMIVASSFVVLSVLLAVGNGENKQAPAKMSQKSTTTLTTPITQTQKQKEKTTPATTTTNFNTQKSSSISNSENQSPADDDASKLQTAIQKGDYYTVRKLAEGGYAPAYLPLAKYYLQTPSTHEQADRYAQKAKRAGIKGAQSVIDDLDALGFYD